MIISDPLESEALKIAQSVRNEIRQSPIMCGDFGVSVTISMGLAYFDPAKSVNCDQVVKLADQSLYQAKNSGRDKIVSYIENSA